MTNDSNNFLHYLKDHIILLDGATGTAIQDLNLSDEAFGGAEFKMLSDLLVMSRPREQVDIHLSYFRAGSHAVETNTFGASPMRLEEYDFSRLDLSDFKGLPTDIDLRKLNYDDMAYHLSKRGAELAVQAKAEYRKEADYDGRPLFAVGSIGPSNRVLSSTAADLNKSTWAEIEDNFYVQVKGLIDGGADVILHETQQDILELKAAVFGSLKAMKEKKVRLPIMAQLTLDEFGKMQIFNTDVHAAIVTLTGIGVDVIGMNCSIGPDLMARSVSALSKYSTLPISVIPNAGLPTSEDGQTVFKMSAEAFAEPTFKYVSENGVNIVGGCCGTRPEHIAALSKKIKGFAPLKRNPKKGHYLSGLQEAVHLDSSENLIRIGERLNVRGSQKVRVAVETEGADINFDALEEVVNEQVQDLGVEVLDVCMDSNLVDTAELLPKVIEATTMDLKAAMCIDSFDADVLNEAITHYPGRPILNSISLEEWQEGVSKADYVLKATAAHHPMYIGLCTTKEGPADTAVKKVAVAKRIVEVAEKYGVTPDQLIIDMNVFPIGSESDESQNFALETLDSIPGIKALHPDILTSLGVGNLSNGLAKKPYMRKVLTSVFIEEGRKRGLDAAIINPHHYAPVESLDKGDVALARDIILKRDMEAFSQLEEIAESKTGRVKKVSKPYEEMDLFESICQKIIDGHKERIPGEVTVDDLTYKYTDRIVVQVVDTLDKIKPLDFINLHLMKAMNTLGEGFAEGLVSLPHLLKSADVMKQVMSFLETLMKHKSGAGLEDKITYKGTVVLGTVYQDVHSIGKDLAKTLLENYGYRVIDLGVQVPLQKFIDTAVEVNADAIGLSALLVQTSNHMITISKMLKEQNLEHIDLLIGGAPVSLKHAAWVAMHGEEDVDKIRSNIFYCASGMDGVQTMEILKSENGEKLLIENRKKLIERFQKAKKRDDDEKALFESLPRLKISLETHPDFEAKKTLAPERLSIDIKEFLPQIKRKHLFSLNWAFGGKSSQKRKNISGEELEALLIKWVDHCHQTKCLEPQSLYGVFPCQSRGDELTVYSTEDNSKVIGTFEFDPVIASDKKGVFSAAQFFNHVDSGKMDHVGLQITTGGPNSEAAIEEFKKNGDSESAHYLQGLSDRIAEDMADHVHQLLREKMAVAKNCGTRYSPGYPAIKNTLYNQTITELLGDIDSIGVKLTDAGQFSPTGSTAAILCFFSEARYS